MKKGIYKNIEKVYRVRGYNDFFESEKDAAEFVQKELLKSYIDSIRSLKELIGNYNEGIRKTRMLMQEATYSDEYILKNWLVEYEIGKLFLHSKRVEEKLHIPFMIRLDTKKGMWFARQTVLYYGKERIRLSQEKIREAKNEIKMYQRKYSELREQV